MARRIDRVNVLLRQEISRVLAVELNDPRLSTLVSITRVSASSDLRQAKVYVSVYGDATDKKEALIGLKSAARYIHRAIRENISLKFIPHLEFHLDESIERGDEVLEMIDQVSKEHVAIEGESEP